MSNTADTSTPEGRALRETARKWMGRVNDAQKREKHWRDDASKAVKAYTGEEATGETSVSEMGVRYDFNILFSNVETIVPAVINSPPAPDVRRRFGGDDPVARDYAELLERAMRVQVDDGRLQTELEAMAQDGFLAGRGIIRVRFKSDFVGGETDRAELQAREEADHPREPEDDMSAAIDERPTNERIGFEAVSWKDCTHGPANRWDGVQWWAFRHAMPAEDLDGFADAPLVRSQGPSEHDDAEESADREVWEVWDRKSRSVLFIAARTQTVIKRVDDPLGLSGFFPIATPVQPIEVTGRLMPVNPFSVYRRLADELDMTTKRIRIITKQLKVKGWYGMEAPNFEAILQADDNEFVPVNDPGLWAAKGGMSAAVAFWPVEKLILVLTALYAQRDQTKQAIYEITGISDIVRGASAASETATAQNIKSQWGSLRIQKMQRMMERAARDIFLMMAEIIPAKFSAETLTRMTDIQIQPSEQEMQPVPMPQPPGMGHNGGPPMGPQMAQPDPTQAEAFQKAAQEAREAEQARQAKLQHLEALQAMMREPAGNYYRIDVETDSTVRADLTRQKSEASEFMTAASGYFAAVGPLVQQGALPMNVAVEIFSSFSRMFNLGKSVEDALDELVQTAKDKAKELPEPDPTQKAAEAEAAGNAEVRKADLALKQQDGQNRMQAAEADRALKGADLQIKGVELQIKRADLALKSQALFGGSVPDPMFGGQSNG